MRKALVFGAKGFVGPYLLAELAEAGYEAKGLDLDDVNILDPNGVNVVIKDNAPDYLINLAAISSVALSWKNPSLTMDVNVKGTLNILDAVYANVPGCKVLLVGSSEEYAPQRRPINEMDPVLANNPYGVSKVTQENFAAIYRRRYGLNIVTTRSFNHTGIGQTETFAIPSFCRQVAEIEKSGKSGKIFVGNLSACRDISDVHDIVHVYRMLLETDMKETLFNVGSGVTHSMQELLEYIISLASQKIEVVQDPERMRPVENPYICCDNSLIRKFWKGTDIKDTIRSIFTDMMRK